MTEKKRFRVKRGKNKYGGQIVDYWEKPFPYLLGNVDVECKYLNDLNDENEKLKQELKSLRKKYNDFSDTVDKRLIQLNKGLIK